MPDQTGEWIDVGGRLTYHPPFVNELFDGPPYSECVPATGVNLINVAFLGQKPATHAEIKALANAANRNRPSEGWHTSDFLDMVRKRYGLSLDQESLSKDQMRERLERGWAVSVGINLETYPQQPWDSGSKSTSGHRILLLGYDSGNVKVMDPMFSQNKGYRGKMVQLDTVWTAMVTGSSNWRPQQVWVHEADRVITTVTIKAVLSPTRTATFTGSNALHAVYDLDHQDNQPFKYLKGTNAFSRQFDMIASIAQQPNQCWKPEGETFIRLRGTTPDMLWANAAASGITADTSTGNCVDNDCSEVYDQGYAEGVADEEAEWADWLGDAPRATSRSVLLEMANYGAGVDEDGVGLDDVVDTAEPESVDPRVPPEETVT